MVGVQKFTGRFFWRRGEYKPPHTLVNLSFLAPPQPNLYCTYTIAPQSVSNVPFFLCIDEVVHEF